MREKLCSSIYFVLLLNFLLLKALLPLRFLSNSFLALLYPSPINPSLKSQVLNVYFSLSVCLSFGEECLNFFELSLSAPANWAAISVFSRPFINLNFKVSFSKSKLIPGHFSSPISKAAVLKSSMLEILMLFIPSTNSFVIMSVSMPSAVFYKTLLTVYHIY